jgi:uncharacterized protein YcnI
MRTFFDASLVGAAVSLVSTLATAHVSVASGPGFADTSQEIVFGVGHGCEGADTSGVRVEIPAEVTSVRVMPNVFGRATIEKDAADLIRAVLWQKDPADVLDSDFGYYKMSLRIRVPNQPFTTLLFPSRQTCTAADGTISTVDWIAATESPDGGGPEPAPALQILPARVSGWNKFTVPVAIADLGTFFEDALIVWKGSAAYSANPTTSELITGTPGVTALTSLNANDEIWVKY